jgi:hypothetical protein
MIIFTNRFLKEMMKYKKHIKDLKENNYEEIPRLDEEEMKSIGHKSIGYLTSVFLNIVGGFFIWFHIILFIIIIFSIILFYVRTLQIHHRGLTFSLFSFIAPIIVLYLLKKSITEWLSIFILPHQSENENNLLNKKVYGILIYFTFIISKSLHFNKEYDVCMFLGCHIAIVSSFLRLIKGIAYNILLMPRVDSSYLPSKWQKKGNTLDNQIFQQKTIPTVFFNVQRIFFLLCHSLQNRILFNTSRKSS